VRIAGLPLLNTVVFPQVVVPVFVSRQQAQVALEAALAGDRMILTVAQRNEDVEIVAGDDLLHNWRSSAY
jgi:ATP-dependent Lon protease